ncbi:lytic transglycosylase domain-containing protein [Granulibacter bethesdensis]|uniref:Invasion family protein n=1 Tax=Granulibacter bethesdensis (strain ATCC BAA-1260 / CGDNIH1) TaxID=391165 RepID=Q0BR86_GRABC|nr:lytic transglycosylase domain-containing protein [Granulibacter bethesdensis]ABI62666.1 Invasion family protein [Granulibacter bethesdensis CGDNIH1]AHJ65748.1 Invasion family protein [Granulibacter bethesdensis CGDNIH4]AHJ68388.1 Invasion family protein [Granulibacter bethesdensis]APH52523.1 Invasion family protein [Granulibacter bethesdensis]APH60128.1 Invasion family protein [Granulibacter bethesdensis]
MSIPYIACMASTASYYHLPPRVLPSIQAVEKGAVGVVHRNANGTEDLGLMQINTSWIEPIAHFTGLSVQATRVRLLMDPCFNIAAAGAILRDHLNASGGNMMMAIGNYHSRTPIHHFSYRRKVQNAASRLFIGP